jgi:protein TonB
VIKPRAPPPPFVPRPEVRPPVPPSAVAVPSVPTPPIAPPVVAPPVIAPPEIAPPVIALPAPPKPSSSRAEMDIACPTQVKPQMPAKAVRDGTEGVVMAQALIRDGSVREVTILSGARVFHAAVQEAMLQYKCASNSGDVLATQKFTFKNE